jgi:hypothetical protein
MDESERMAPDRIGLGEDALRRLLEVGRTLVSELDLQSVLRRVLETARELTGARYAALGILDEGKEELERFITGWTVSRVAGPPSVKSRGGATANY